MGKNVSAVVVSAFLASMLLLSFSGLALIVRPTARTQSASYDSDSSDTTNDSGVSQNAVATIPGFHANDTLRVTALTGVLASVPPIFGYSEADGNKIFPPYEYPRCIDKNPPVPRTYVNLDYSRNRFTMRCLGTFPGKYVLGPIYNVTFTNQYELYDRWKVREYTGPVRIPKDTEFVIATCRQKTAHFELHKNLPRYNKELKFKTLRKIQKLKPAHDKPLIIAMVTLDSFSRNHFFRKLPRVAKYLSELELNGTWKVTDFKVHNIIGTDTVENQARIFASNMTEFHETGYRYPDKLGEDGIWAKLRKLGFVSLLGFEACAFKMKAFLGRRPSADHVVNPFFCAASRLSSYTSSKHSGPVQRCLGPNMSHVYLMNYTLNFLRMYGGTNEWVYNHFTAAHESTGQHASTLDRDLRDYLVSMMGQFGNKAELVIFLMGDHGMRYGNYKSGTYAVQEHRLPAFFLIAKRQYLEKIPGVFDTLEHNSLRLTTKPDIRRTILSLALRHYGKHDINIEPHGSFVDLLTEKVENDRTCDDVEIPLWYCSIYPLKNLPEYIYNNTYRRYAERTQEERKLSDFLHMLAKETVTTITSFVHAPRQSSLGKYCSKLTFRNIQQANTAYSPSTKQHLFKMTLGVMENLDVRLDSYIMISDSPNPHVPPTEQEEYPSFPVHYQGQKMFGKVIMVFRLDRYAGTCERVAREADLEAEHCLCTHEALVSAKHKKLKKD